jgi:hypothetical protein
MNRGKDRIKGDVEVALEAHFSERFGRRRASLQRAANQAALVSFDERESADGDMAKKIGSVMETGGPAELEDLLLDAGLDPAEHFENAWRLACEQRRVK